MAINFNYGFLVHKEIEGGGYWGECLDLKGCLSEGKTVDELKEHLQEALDLYLSEPDDSKVIFPSPKKHNSKKNIIYIKPSFSVAFAASLRMLRLKHKLTQKQMAASMGYKSTTAYQKLESPKTANPGLETLVRLKRVLPDLKIDSII
jgi:antitoxin HicB